MTKRFINTDFFKTWSENSAYVLGYICADGCLIKRNGRKRSLVLNITSKDRGHLDKINRVLGSDYKVSGKVGGSGKLSYQIQVSSYEFCSGILDLGISPRKTFSLKPVRVPRPYFRDFVRGYFDADGSVYIYNVNGTPQLKIGICGASLKFIEFLASRIVRELGCPPKSIHRAERPSDKVRQPLYSFVFYVDDGLIFQDYLYGHRPELYMKRKFDIFQKWKLVERRKYIRVS